MRYDLVLADADGTLYDFLAGERIAFAATLESFGLPHNEAAAALYSRVNARHWAMLERGETTQQRLRVERFADFLAEWQADNAVRTEKSGSDCPEALPLLPPVLPDPEALCAAYIQQLAQQRIPMAGAEDFLRRVSACAPVYLVTNGIGNVQRGRVEKSELRRYFSDLLISEELGHFKPDPFMIFEAMRRAGVTDPRRVIFIGDSLTADIAAACNAGVPSLLFTNGAPAPELCPATFCAPTLAEAADIILAP